MTALVLSAGLAAGDAQAALQGRAVPTNGDPIAIEIGEGQLLRLDRSMASVFIANPEIADVTAKSDRLLYPFGKRVGTTTLFAMDANDNVIANLTVSVTHSQIGRASCREEGVSTCKYRGVPAHYKNKHHNQLTNNNATYIT